MAERTDSKRKGTRKSTEELEREADATRADIDRTLDELQERLSPGELVDQALRGLRGSGASAFFGNLGRTVRDNPIPVALVGTGVAWLMASGPDGHHATHAHVDEGLGEGGDGEGRLRRAADAASEGAESLRHRAGAVAARGRSAAEGARQKGHELQERARSRAAGARRRWDRMVDEQPFLLGFLGFAAGAALASALPPTEVEDEWMGHVGDEVRAGAAEKARETAEKARETAERGAERGAEAAKRSRSERTTGADSPRSTAPPGGPIP